MAKVHDPFFAYLGKFRLLADELAASEGSTLAGAARTDDPPAVLMSGRVEPAGAAKPHA